MDTSSFSESKFLTIEVINASVSKVCVIIDEAKPVEKDYGESLQCTVSLDGKMKLWGLNMTSVKNMQVLGIDSAKWIGKKVQLSIVVVKGKEQIIGRPIDKKDTND